MMSRPGEGFKRPVCGPVIHHHDVGAIPPGTSGHLLLDAQTPQALQRIEEAVSQATRQYIRGASFRIPIATTLASAGVAR